MQTRNRTIETTVGISILFVLFIISGWMYHRQQKIHPAVTAYLKSSVRMENAGAMPDETITGKPPNGIVPMSPPETFTPENLSDKINGKAELYLSAGFQELVAQRFSAVESDRERSVWAEVYIYKMGTFENAFAVFSAQRREEAEPLNETGRWPEHGYRTRNGAYLIVGSRYVEIVGASTTETTGELVAALVQAMKPADLEEKTDDGGRTDDYFPKSGRTSEPVSLISADAFGYAGFDRVYTAAYHAGEIEVTAFLSKRADGASAEKLHNGYVEFLLQFGGKRSRAAQDESGIDVVEILGFWEAVFHKGRYVGGVHEAETKAAAVETASMLMNAVTAKEE